MTGASTLAGTSFGSAFFTTFFEALDLDLLDELEPDFLFLDADFLTGSFYLGGDFSAGGWE